MPKIYKNRRENNIDKIPKNTQNYWIILTLIISCYPNNSCIFSANSLISSILR